MSPLVMIYSPYFVYCTIANMVDGNSMHTFHTILFYSIKFLGNNFDQ